MLQYLSHIIEYHANISLAGATGANQLDLELWPQVKL
jgi:hypothetical protein